MYEIYCKLRDEKGVKDADVARETEITKSTFTDWKNGRSVPGSEKMKKLYKSRYIMFKNRKKSDKLPDFSNG